MWQWAECFNVVCSDAEWLEEFEKYLTFLAVFCFSFPPFLKNFNMVEARNLLL